MGEPSNRRILFTNHALVERAGSEVVTRDLAIGLKRRGWRPIVYSPVAGAVASDLAEAGITVVDDVRAIDEPPAVIHGQHHVPAMAAMLRFPHTPAIFVCHGWSPAEERPPVFPSIRRYVAVDDVCRERITATTGASDATIRTIYNAVDLARFAPRAPLPARPRRALVFSNYATNTNYAAVLREACGRAGISEVDVVGAGVGTSVTAPESMLPHYDLVFAKARCALEALVVGAAVVVVDAAGLAGLVTRDNVAKWRPLNFGFRTLQPERLRVTDVCAEIARYDPAESAVVSEWIREQADSERAIDAFESVYQDAMGASPPAPRDSPGWAAGDASVAAAASAYLVELGREVRASAVREAGARERAQQLGEALAEAERQRQQTAARLVETEQALGHLRRTLTDLQSSRTWRAFAPYRRVRRWLAERAGGTRGGL